MSVCDELKKVVTKDGYGNFAIDKKMSDYFWGEGEIDQLRPWEPKARIPQLETLIEVFNGTPIAIAGGAILGSYAAVEYGDIDVFPLTPDAIPQAQKLLTDIGYKCFHDEEFSKQYKRAGSSSRVVQLITVHADVNGAVQKVLRRFDLSVCQLAVLNRMLYSNTTSLKDVQSKVLRVRGTLSVSSLINRIIKYHKRGFDIIDEIKDEKANTNRAG